MCTPKSRLMCTPKAFDAVCVYVPTHILSGIVVNPLMAIPQVLEVAIVWEAVGEDAGTLLHCPRDKIEHLLLVEFLAHHLDMHLAFHAS